MGKRRSDDATETSYYAVRVALARALSEVGAFIAEKGLAEEGAPVILRFIAKIAARFEVIVSEKLASEVIPVIGAVGGATINLLFINHFQSMARGHFIVRNLERKYGEEMIRKEYEGIAQAQSTLAYRRTSVTGQLKLRPWLNKWKDSAVSAGGRLIAGYLLKNYGEVKTLNIDAKRKTIVLEITLKGENELTRISIGAYEFLRAENRASIVAKEVTTSKEWLTALLKDYLVDREIQIPDKFKNQFAILFEQL